MNINSRVADAWLVGGGVTGRPVTWDDSSTRPGLYGQRPEALQPARITRSDRASSLALLYNTTKRSFLIGAASLRAERAWISLRYLLLSTEKGARSSG